MESTFVVFTICFACLAFMFGVCPPQEFWASGITLENLASRWLGNEEDDFVQYNIRRLSLRLVFQSALPLLYFCALKWCYPESTEAVLGSGNSLDLWSVAVIISVSVFLAAGSLVFYFWSTSGHSSAKWSNSPTASLLGKFSRHPLLPSWLDIAKSVDDEYKDLDKFTSILSGWNARTIVTRSWIIRVGHYRMDFARQDLCQLEIVSADDHAVSQQGDVTGAQYVTIKVHSIVAGVSDFCLRLNSRELEDFKQHVATDIRVPDNVVLVKSVLENFVIAFREQVSTNERIPRNQLAIRDVETCVGCYLTPADVKLRKCCEGATCVSCNCRPMWCCSCMAMWFAHQQEQYVPETWMTGTAPCPNCRSVFCMRDVCPIDL